MAKRGRQPQACDLRPETGVLVRWGTEQLATTGVVVSWCRGDFNII